MSAELYTSPRPSDNNGSVQTTTTGGTKPLHRFIKGQPKIVGVVILVLGAAMFTFTAVVADDRSSLYARTVIPPGFFQGALCIVCGVLYIITEHNPTKKTVTMCLALSIFSLLVTLWTLLHSLPVLAHGSRHYEYMEENITETEYSAMLQYDTMGQSLECIYLVKFLTGGIIFVVMSTLGGMALRSTNSQAVVVMKTVKTEPAAVC